MALFRFAWPGGWLGVWPIRVSMLGVSVSFAEASVSESFGLVVSRGLSGVSSPVVIR